jgi:hypothetical protein
LGREGPSIGEAIDPSVVVGGFGVYVDIFYYDARSDTIWSRNSIDYVGESLPGGAFDRLTPVYTFLCAKGVLRSLYTLT